jgi:hypothetical protein
LHPCASAIQLPNIVTWCLSLNELDGFGFFVSVVCFNLSQYSEDGAIGLLCKNTWKYIIAPQGHNQTIIYLIISCFQLFSVFD